MKLGKIRPLLGTCSAILIFTASAFAQSSGSNGPSSGGGLMVIGDVGPNESDRCKTRFAEFVHELDGILASHPKTIDPIYELFRRAFPMKDCSLEDTLTIARASRFFVGSEESPNYHNIAFDSAGVGSGYGFAVQISLNKKTGDFELPFAKVNGF